jgi:oligopeptide/dipeptide ABC transporter ATP-binding protein
MSEQDIIMEVNSLKKYFPIKKGIFRKTVGNVKAVDDVSFYIKEGETLGLVGESGCGKSTTGRCLIRLLDATDGEVKFKKNNEMIDLNSLDKKELKKIRRDIQIIFQDPFSSLDSRMSVRDIIAEPLKLNKIGTKKERTDKVRELLQKVGLRDYQMNRYPHEFSGGQRQRIGIARALALNPDLIVCDEPVSALDVSVQAQIINLMKDLQEEMGLTYLFIAHDLSVIEYISDRVMVMYLGKIVEVADADEIYSNPEHPYTEALLKAIPIADPRAKNVRLPLEGSVPNPANPPSGCNFHTRCLYAEDICRKKEPELQPKENDQEHFVACHFHDKLKLDGYTAGN